jgi:hypothetical protein
MVIFVGVIPGALAVFVLAPVDPGDPVDPVDDCVPPVLPAVDAVDEALFLELLQAAAITAKAPITQTPLKHRNLMLCIRPPLG